MENMHYFTDSGEVGSAHISLTPKRNAVYTSHGAVANITLLESNVLRGVYRIDLAMQLPAAATINGEDRTREMKELPISTTITLEKGCRYVKLHTRLTNEIRDHKLAVNFPSGVTKADFADSESAWDVANRTVKWRDHKDNAEGFFPFQPMQNFVDVSDGKKGFAVVTKGLREYEIEDDKNRIVKITLIRTQRAYMTANANMTVEELDKYTGQHSFGTLEYEYALYPHAGKWNDADVINHDYQCKVPVKAVQGVPHAGTLPANASFIKISHEKKVLISALKLAESGNGLILRVWNTTGETLPLDIQTILPLTGVDRVRLDEQFIETLPLQKGKFSLSLGAHKIETFLLKVK